MVHWWHVKSDPTEACTAPACRPLHSAKWHSPVIWSDMDHMRCNNRPAKPLRFKAQMLLTGDLVGHGPHDGLAGRGTREAGDQALPQRAHACRAGCRRWRLVSR